MVSLDLLQSETKRRLLELMKRRGEVTLSDAMEVIDRARPTLRDHLDQMGRDGLVARRTKQQGRGRPSMCYRMTPFAEQLFPGQEATLFADFLTHLQEKGHGPLIEDFFEAFWDARLEKVKDRLTEPLETAGVQQIVNVLEEVLREEGFMPEVHLDDERVVVQECNCPFSEIVDATDLPCASESCFYEALFERVERTAHIPEGDSACVYELRVLDGNEA